MFPMFLIPHAPHVLHVPHRSTAVQTVFLLIRAKRGASPASRLDSLLSSQLFDTVKSQVPPLPFHFL